jgi:membrane-associated phospholipid phosphatase
VPTAESRPSRWAARLSRIRLEEAIFLVAFLPTTLLTIWANLVLAGQGVSSRKIEGGLLRLFLAGLLAFTLGPLDRAMRSDRLSPRARGAAEFFRTMLPFVLCVAVYTNLHDTIRFVNPNDIHAALVWLEELIFGGQPVLWAEAWITPTRTEVFSLFYVSFPVIAPSAVIVLWFSGRRVEARQVLLAAIVCFYSGYVLYLIFPAAPPRLYLASLGLFTRDLHGGSIAGFQQFLIEMMPNHASRAAFPSLHAAVSFVTLFYVWRYCRWYFPILLVVVTGLLLATVYLRHHYVVDLIAGALMLPWVAWATPRLDRWWTARQAARC